MLLLCVDEALCLSVGFFLKILFIYFIRERGREKERERNSSVQEIPASVDSCTPPSRDLARNRGMCPNRESNQQPLGSQVGALSPEPHQPRLCLSVYISMLKIFSGSLKSKDYFSHSFLKIMRSISNSRKDGLF